MSRAPHAIRRVIPILVTALLAMAAAVAVVLALPDGRQLATTSQPVGSGITTPPAGRTSAPVAASADPIAVPALPGSSDAGPAADASLSANADPSAEPPVSAGLVTSASRAASAATTAPRRSAAPPATATAAARTKPPAAPKPPTTSAKPSAAPTTSARPTTKPPTTSAKPPASTARPAAPNFGIPVTLGNATQLITVTAKTKTATVGTLRAWEKTAAGTWRTVYGPVTANLGAAGIGPASESYSRTPLGTFTLTEAFGRLANPGTTLPYRVTGPNDWWVSDVRAPSYNTWQTCAKASCPFNTRLAEHLQTITPYYDYAVVMDVNRSPVVKGGGSAFFLHVSVGAPTAGCVAINKSTLVQIMRWLKPAAHPRIATGIG